MLLKRGVELRCPAATIHRSADPGATERIQVSKNELTFGLRDEKLEISLQVVFWLSIEIGVVDTHEFCKTESCVGASDGVTLVNAGDNESVELVHVRFIRSKTDSRMEIDLDLLWNFMSPQENINHIPDIVCSPIKICNSLKMVSKST